tara:strand:- start:1063 stop:1278 length:216 start_codon:yes stop_codon:yes gene_type:complete
MKVDNQVLEELQKIRNAVDNMYDVLNVSLYKKNTAAKVTYSEVNPFNLVADNFEYISTKIREIQDSEIVGD